MKRITPELVRKRCEHNEGEIGTLEELSLHQEKIEKMENLQNWCRELKILLFQGNLLTKIENMKKMKKLEYVNFSLNCIEKVENLEGCEFLNKLDLTSNFISDLTSIENLKGNIHLKELFMMGNPCSLYKGYREYVIVALPQLEELDGRDITIAERIQAVKDYDKNRRLILEQQAIALEKRRKEKIENSDKLKSMKPKLTEEEMAMFWNSESKDSPETRIEIAIRSEQTKEKEKPKKKSKRSPWLFGNDGTPLNCNEACISYTINEDEEKRSLILDLAIYKYLDSELLDVDVHPSYVKVLVKDKVFQLVLFQEISPDKSTAKRSQTTGHLTITMPLDDSSSLGFYRPINTEQDRKTNKKNEKGKLISVEAGRPKKTREFLEIQQKDKSELDFSKILEMKYEKKHRDKILEDFDDNPEVPPLE